MAEMPKRRKLKDNPYSLNIENNIYIINFKDNKNIVHDVEVSKEVFDVFNKSELDDIKILHEYERHIEHLDFDENTMYHKLTSSEESTEDIVEEKLLNEKLKSFINELSSIQKQRIVKYYFEGKTLDEIAKEEKCSKSAVKYSIDIALEKISKKI